MEHVFFLLAVLTVLATPGPTNTLLAVSGVSVGLHRSLRLVPAGMGGYLVSISVLHGLIGPVIALHPLASPALKAAASLWLFHCAGRLWREGGSGFTAAASPISVRQVFVTTLLNPKGVIFAFAVFPPVPLAQLPPWFGEFFLVDGLVAVAWIGLGGLIAHSAGSLATPLRVRRAAALGLAAFATVFASAAVAAVH